MCFAEEILDVASASLNEEAQTNPEELDSNISEDDNEERGTYVGAATFANVFRLRTCFDQTWNVAYFFFTETRERPHASPSPEQRQPRHRSPGT